MADMENSENSPANNFEDALENSYQYSGSLSEEETAGMTPAQLYITEVVEVVNELTRQMDQVAEAMSKIDEAIQTLDKRTRANHNRIAELEERI